MDDNKLSDRLAGIEDAYRPTSMGLITIIMPTEWADDTWSGCNANKLVVLVGNWCETSARQAAAALRSLIPCALSLKHWFLKSSSITCYWQLRLNVNYSDNSLQFFTKSARKQCIRRHSARMQQATWAYSKNIMNGFMLTGGPQPYSLTSL